MAESQRDRDWMQDTAADSWTSDWSLHDPLGHSDERSGQTCLCRLDASL